MKGDLLYMELSALAYEKPEYVKAMAPKLGYQMNTFLNDGSSQGYLFKGKRCAVLAYRGTEASEGDLWDIMSNLRFHAREWEGPGKAHLGYVRQYRRIRDELMKVVKGVSGGIPLVVTGHSMGGAIATMAAADAYQRDWKFSRVVTFGSPATMNAEGHAAITCERTRYVNCMDPVPLWPPSFTINHGVPATKINSETSVFNRHASPAYLRAMKNYEEKLNA